MPQMIAILGMGKSGRSVAQYCLAQASAIPVCFDAKVDLLMDDPEIQLMVAKGVLLLPDTKPLSGMLSGISQLIVSPGVGWHHPIVKMAKEQNIPVLGEAQFALEKLKDYKIVGVTGTNGKTTATLLITHILNANGYSAVALGNVGHSLSSYLLEEKKEDLLIVELSSYQLEDLQGPIFDLGVVINITPDHLDRYDSFLDYVKAKSYLQRALKPDANFIVSSQAKETLGDFCNNPNIELFDAGDTDELPLGQTQLAAMAVVKKFGVDQKSFLSGMNDFSMPPCRMEFIAEIKGVKFYNDSKATNVESTIHAVNSFDKKTSLLLILGGADKGLSYKSWDIAFSGRVKKVYLIGQAAEKIYGELKKFSKQKVSCLQEAVQIAYSEAKEGDSIILSPGCASFDQFKDYKHRGEVFKEEVEQIIEKEKIGSISR